MWFHSINILLSLSIFLILVAGISIFPIHLKIRQKTMARLANEFGLKYSSNPPSFLDFYFKFLFFYPDWKVNNIRGIIDGHEVNIFDNLFPGPKIFFGAMNYGKRYTVINIDGNFIKDKFKSFKIGDSCLTSISWLRKLLNDLKQK